jgi:hypothetical protein
LEDWVVVVLIILIWRKLRKIIWSLLSILLLIIVLTAVIASKSPLHFPQSVTTVPDNISWPESLAHRFVSWFWSWTL